MNTYAYYTSEINEGRITSTARVDCIWDAEGIWVDLNYSSVVEGSFIDYGDYQCCFASLYSDDNDNQPSERMWSLAISVAKHISEKYTIPLDISKERKIIVQDRNKQRGEEDV